MRIHQFIACAGIAMLALPAFADPSIAPSPSPSVAATAQARHAAQATYRLDRDEARRMRGAYLLDDGRTITVTSAGGKLFADLDGKREELVRVDWAKFVSRDTGARLAFNHVPYADEVVLDQAAR
jgi:hypothetical protein